MGLLERFRVDRGLSWIERLLSIVANVPVFWALVGGSVIAWYARASGWMAQFDTFGLIVAAVGGALLIYLIVSFGRHLNARSRQIATQVELEKIRASSSTINPLDDVFSRVRISTESLRPPYGNIIFEKTFRNCDLVGPCNAAFFKCHFDGNKGDECDAVVIKPLSANPQIQNGLLFLNCTFHQCRFYFITFFVPSDMLEWFNLYNWSGMNWLTAEAPKLIEAKPDTSNESAGQPAPQTEQENAPSAEVGPTFGGGQNDPSAS
jgi:hypothetical protein